MENRWKRWFYISRKSWAAQAERKVQRILERLPMNHFTVLDDIKFKYGNIDHLVIRDDGAIFMIETKSHRGKVTFDGNRLLINGTPLKRNPISQLHRNIRWLRDKMKKRNASSLWITAIVVFPFAVLNIRSSMKRLFPNATASMKSSIKQVNVVAVDDLLSFVRNYP